MTKATGTPKGRPPAAYGKTKPVKVPLGCLDAVRRLIVEFKAQFQ